MLKAYNDFINRLFYPNIALGVLGYIAIPAAVGAVVGGKKGAAVGGALAIVSIKVQEAQMQREVDEGLSRRHPEET